ncbi:hypothetical protein CR513_20010, partial [Mucuna pruriens]
MESISKLFWVLVLCVIVTAHKGSAEELKGKGVIEGDVKELKGKSLIQKVCTMSPTRNLCVEVLSSDPVKSPNATLKDLAIISLRMAANNASGILTDAKKLIDDQNLNPDVQQGLADCKETILDAESQLEDTIAALLVDAETDAHVWLKAALTAIDTCDASIPGDHDQLSVKSLLFRKLCNISIAVSGLLTKPKLLLL